MRFATSAGIRPRSTLLAVCIAAAFATPLSAGSKSPPATRVPRTAAAGVTAHTLPVTSCADDGHSGTLRIAVESAASGDTIDLTGLKGKVTVRASVRK